MTRLKQLRKHRGLTQEYVAMKINISLSTLRKLETGDNEVANTKTITVYRLAKFYEVSVGYLLGLEDI